MCRKQRKFAELKIVQATLMPTVVLPIEDSVTAQIQ